MNQQLEYGQPADIRERNDALIAALTVEQVNAAWREHVRPQAVVWGIFADLSKLK
jgi:hypothetical protein